MTTTAPFARWVLALQKALPDNIEDAVPRSIRCFWCDSRFTSSYHEKGCPVRAVASNEPVPDRNTDGAPIPFSWCPSCKRVIRNAGQLRARCAVCLSDLRSLESVAL